MQIEIKPSEPISLLFGEKVLTITRPRIGKVREMSKRLKDSDGTVDQLTTMAEFCVTCGVPQDVVDDWDMAQLASFMKQLSSDGEKKS